MSQGTESEPGGQSGAGLRPVNELFGKAKPNVARGASQIKGAVDPRKGWTPERRQSFAAKRSATAARKRAEAGKLERSGEERPILAVKGQPEPPEPAPAPTAKDIEGWAGLIYLGHALGASIVNIPELRLDKSEANELSAASMNVMRHYGSSILSEKTQDWLKFGMVAAATYGPKMARMRERVREAKAKKPWPPAGMNTAGGFERDPAPAAPPTATMTMGELHDKLEDDPDYLAGE